MNRQIFVRFIVLIVLVLAVVACAAPGKPTVVIISPPSGSQYHEGEDVAVQSTATDSTGVVRVELVVDGNVVRVDPSPTAQGQPSFSLIQTWKATQGAHTILVRAYNAIGAASDPAGISISVLQGVALAGTPTPAPTLPGATATTTSALPATATTAPPSATSPGACTNNAAFVTDLTVPDGSVFAAGQAFDKKWQMSNNGTCAWGSGYQFVFVSGEAMATATVISVPTTAPGATAVLLVPMTAPAAPGTHTGQWQMRNSTGGLFGQKVSVKIVVPGAPPPAATATNTPPPSGCVGTPNIVSFTANPPTITAGGTSNLQWGAVTNADSVEIDHSIGGVPAPGNVNVSPVSTTTYTMTAHCGANTATKQATVTVNPAASTTVIRCSIQSESGEVIKSGASRAVTQALYVGDDNSNNSYRAFFSFDINDVAGKTVDVGNLNIGASTTQGNPFGLGGTLWVGVLDYGTLNGTDYDMAGTAIQGITSGPSGQYSIKPTIQSAVNASKSRIQLRFHFAAETNNNNAADNLFFPSNNNVCLTITYH